MTGVKVALFGTRRSAALVRLLDDLNVKHLSHSISELGTTNLDAYHAVIVTADEYPYSPLP